VIADSGESQLGGDPLLRGLEFVEDFASQFNIKVVNMSLGESTSSGGVNDNTIPPSDDISQEIQTLEKMGITVVAAAGNSYANDPVPGESYPAVVSTISVANVWADSGRDTISTPIHTDRSKTVGPPSKPPPPPTNSPPPASAARWPIRSSLRA
jgi:hypothetical protein